MSKSIEIAKKYFAVSNTSNMDEIRKLFHLTTTYSSQNTGVYAGDDQIIEMQTSFHQSFETLHWEIISAEEIRPGVVYIDFIMTGKKKDGTDINLPGDEYVVVIDDKIQHVEVRNKSA